MHCEPNPQAGAGEDCRRLIEHLTEGVGGVRSMRRAERSQGDMQLAIGDADVACSGEQLMQQGSPLLIDAGVVRSQFPPSRAWPFFGIRIMPPTLLSSQSCEGR